MPQLAGKHHNLSPVMTFVCDEIAQNVTTTTAIRMAHEYQLSCARATGCARPVVARQLSLDHLAPVRTPPVVDGRVRQRCGEGDLSCAGTALQPFRTSANRLR